jgi:hypothetical protein
MENKFSILACFKEKHYPMLCRLNEVCIFFHCVF